MREHLIELIGIIKRLLREVEPAADIGHRENLAELHEQLEDLLETISGGRIDGLRLIQDGQAKRIAELEAERDARETQLAEMRLRVYRELIKRAEWAWNVVAPILDEAGIPDQEK